MLFCGPGESLRFLRRISSLPYNGSLIRVAYRELLHARSSNTKVFHTIRGIVKLSWIGHSKHRSSTVGRMFAALMASLLVISAASCSPSPDNTQSASTSASTTKATGSVAIFTPSDGITLSQHTPLNKWTAFVSELSASLRTRHMDKQSISTQTQDTLDEQSRAVQDYVVNHVTQASGNSSSASSSGSGSESLIVAPVIETTSTERQFGDYLGKALQHSSSGTGTQSEGTSSPSSSASSSKSASATASSSASSDGDTESSSEQASVSRMISALNLAKKSGMHVVLLSSTLEGFTPDLFVPMSSVQQMAQVQAKQLVSKLELDKTSTENPKQIEIMLPSDSANSSKSSDTTTSSSIDQTAFAAMWEVLGPYFRNGTVVSPSALLDKNSTADSWKSVTFDASNEDSIKKELTNRLGKNSKASGKHTRIDGILATNDYVASAVTTTLSSLGYTGTAADINPEITISGIVDNITGKKDLKKSKAPDPSVAPEGQSDSEEQSDSTSSSDSSASSDSSTDSEKDGTDDSSWPIVTGYGAYLDNIPGIVDGQQWMTALEDRKTLADTLAQALALMNANQSLSTISSIASAKSNGITAPTLTHALITVSASNLKSALIDTDYVTAADAGL